MIQDGKILDHIKSFQSHLPDVRLYNPHLNFSKEKERERGEGERERENGIYKTIYSDILLRQ